MPADPSHAFISQFRLEEGSGKDGPLAGRTLAVKDLFDVSRGQGLCCLGEMCLLLP